MSKKALTGYVVWLTNRFRYHWNISAAGDPSVALIGDAEDLFYCQTRRDQG